jgi:hypothetical protein
MSNLIAVETSDIVGSTKLSTNQLSLAIKTLRSYIEERQLTKGLIAEFYRGDAYQIMYPNATHSLKNLLLLKLYMLSQLDFTVKITQSLAIGYVPVPVSSLHDRMDEVFVKSGRQLEQVNKGEIGISLDAFVDADYLALGFLNRILEGLSAKQASVLFWYIKGEFPEHKKIACQLNMTRQNVNTHLKRGNADLIRGFICHFENIVQGEHL